MPLLCVIMLPAAWALAQRPEPDGTVDAAVRKEVIDTLVDRLDKDYIFPDVAAKMGSAIREHAANKEYDGITSAREFAETLTAHLQRISHDKHLRVRFEQEPLRREQGPPTAEERERFRQFLTRVNYGFERVERLEGNIGYLELRGFMDPEGGGDTVAAAMTFLSNTEALIVDLRKNGGGDPAMVALISSYLFSGKPVHLNDLYWRPANETHQYWTLPWVPGKRYAGKPVFVLTSSGTFSGAEEFAYNLKNLKRATIVGETTGGGAHPGEIARVAEHFAAFIPSGRAINPISRTDWEGTGVEPDVKIDAELALKKAHLLALQGLEGTIADPRLKQMVHDKIATLEKELNQ